MSNTCKQCRQTFGVTKDDLAFYSKISPVYGGKKYVIPSPTLCPDCRLQRRLAQRDNRRLYHRKCDLTGKQMISIHRPDKEIVVYDKAIWWSDAWDPLSYGRSFDFSRPFFRQFQELQQIVPRMSLQYEHNENSDYTHNVSRLKNCYLLFTSDLSQNCAYGFWIERSRDCYDSFLLDECELCYECFFSKKLYHCFFVYNSSQCSESHFLFDCRNCKECLMCWGLRNKQYCIANIQYTKEQYQKNIKEFPMTSYINREKARQKFSSLITSTLRPSIHTQGTVIDSSGDLLVNCQNCQNCYELVDSKDCINTIGGFHAFDAVDCTYVMGELGYENCECFPMPQHSAFNINCYTGSDLYYCDTCMQNCQNCFGCIGLKRATYCIFNKQYTKEEYEKLVPKIIAHMKSTHEWGEFFPIHQSLFAYNGSEAYESFPCTQTEAQQHGWLWEEDAQEKENYLGPAISIPDDISNVQNELSEKILRCEVTGKPYKIIPQELKFYREMKIPIPHKCPDQRSKERMEFRNPRMFWNRNCSQCKADIQTTYAPERPEKVLCEACYQKSVY